MRRGKLLLPLLMSLLLLAACGKMEYSFTVSDGQLEYTAELRTGEAVEGPVMIYTAGGDIIYARDGYKIDEAVYGAVINPPERTVMDVYAFAKAALEADEPVLIIYLDGFGWDSYEAALEDGRIPNLAGLTANKALAMYPTITPVNYAAMVTGRPPAQNGVTERGIHALDCESIFDVALSRGKRACIVEGDMQILTFSVSQELNPDVDGDGDTDNEVFQSAVAAIQDGCDLLLVHFHGIDDISHATGPHSDQTMEKIEETDARCGQLMDVWDGRVIVVSDHGQHENDGNGDPEYADKRGVHGAFTASDLYIPLLTN